MEMDDDSSDSSTPETLDQFREKWKHELNTTKRTHSGNDGDQSAAGCVDSKKADDQVNNIFHR